MTNLDSILKSQDITFPTKVHPVLSCIGEGNGNPLQCSCLENPRDGGAWWAAVYGVTKSRTRLKWLCSSSSSQAMVFTVITYGCESWTVKKAERWRIDAFELWCWRRLLRVPWTARRSNQSILKEINQSWIFIGRTDVEAEVPILWPSDMKNQLTGKDPEAGKNWGQEEKGTTENEMVGWHHWLNGHEYKQTLGYNKGQGCLACHRSWGRKESDMT